MKIPKQHRKFSVPTLVIIGDLKKAKFLKAHEEELAELKVVESPEPPKAKTEGMVRIRGGSRTVSPAGDVNDADTRKLYAKNLAEEIGKMLESKETEKVIMIMNAELCHKVKEAMNKNHRAAIAEEIDKDLMKEPMKQVLERITENKNAL